MKKLFWGIIFLALASVGVFKGYLWYQVNQQLTEIKEQIAPVATLKYGWIFSTFDGEVGVRDIEITPYLLKGTITIDELSIKANDAAALLALGDQLDQRLPPEALRIKTVNMSFPLDGQFDALFSSLDVQSDSERSAEEFNPLGVYSCGDTVAVQGAELRAMGYDRFNVSSEIGYRFDSQAKRILLDAMADSESMGRSELTVDIGVAGNDIYDVIRTNTLPVVNRASWRFNDNGYFRRLSFYCSQKTGTERTDYVDQAAMEWDADLNDHGITLNSSLVKSYRDYMLDGGLLDIEINPDRDIDYTSLYLFSANDIVSMLNLRIKLNNELIPDLSLTVNEDQLSGLLHGGSQGASHNGTSDSNNASAYSNGAQDSQAAVTIKKQFIATDVEAAEAYLRRKAQVELDTGKHVEGVIKSVDEHVIEIEQVVEGGSVSYPLRKRNITSFKIWRQELNNDQ